MLPSLPMFLLIPTLLRSGINFWWMFTAGCALTAVLHLLMTVVAPRFGVRL